MDMPRTAMTAPRWLAGLALLALVVIVLLVLHRTHDILLLVFLGIVFGVFLDAVARGVSRVTHLPRPWSVLASLLLFLFIAGLISVWLVPRVAPDLVHLSERLPQALQSLGDLLRNTNWGSAILDRLSEFKNDIGLTPQTARQFFGLFSTLLGGMVGALVIFILGIYFASEPNSYTRGVLALVPEHGEERARQVLGELGHALRWWLVGRLLSMLVVFLLTWLGLVLLDVPLPLLLAAIAGLLSFVPNIGPILSAIPAVLVPLADGGLQQAVHVVLLYIAVQTLESYTITPLIQRKAVSLPPALLLTFQLLMGVLAGFLGVFVATPLLVTIVVLVKMLYVCDRLGKRVPLP